MASDSEESIASESSTNSSEQEHSPEEIEVISFVEPYEDEPLASSDDDEVDQDEEEEDVDGLTARVLEARFERQITVNEWLVKFFRLMQ